VNGAVWVELSGEIIIARLRGEPTAELLASCQSQVVQLAREAGRSRVLYDSLEMLPPHADVPWAQRELDAQLDLPLRRAIVVPTSKLAYLARLAFGAGDYRVFYNDIAAAVRWLTDSPAEPG
jgi:hypothetical protein